MEQNTSSDSTYSTPEYQNTPQPNASSHLVATHNKALDANKIAVAVNILIYGVEILFVFIEILIVMRFIMILFAASPSSSFVAWVYTNSENFVKPFSGAFPPLSIGVSSVDFTSILALFIYGIVHFVVIELAPRFRRVFR